MLEREIRGHFQKFNSNNGWTGNEDPILDAFSHWTWTSSNGDFLVCDLQGIRGEPGNIRLSGRDQHYYMLTDPCINSKEQEFGMNDLGQAGISAFFARHRCNYVCRLFGIDSNRPTDTALAGLVATVIPVNHGTSYSFGSDLSSNSELLSVLQSIRPGAGFSEILSTLSSRYTIDDRTIKALKKLRKQSGLQDDDFDEDLEDSDGCYSGSADGSDWEE